MKIQLFTDNELEALIFGKYSNNFSLLKIGDEPSTDVDLIILNINASKNERSKRLGFSFLQKIRRDYFIATPVIAYSFENLADDFPILQTKGVSFLRMPFSSADLSFHINRVQNKLTESELIEIVRGSCNLKEEWRMISHQIGGYLSNYSRHKNQIQNLFNEWTKSVNRFASEEAKSYLKRVRNLLDLPFASIELKDLSSAIQALDGCLQGKKTSLPGDFIKKDVLPKYPPKGFSKILIADDEPLDSLIFDLQNEYNYEVVGQAKGINEAKRQVEEKKPTVILSDFYFKRFEYDKTTDKKFGIEFMRFAKKFNVGSTNTPKNPIVAVISKTWLDPLEVPSGVMDCSGTRNATNPEFIHETIWAEARRTGVTEAEMINGLEWMPEYYCRQRLESYQSDLPKLIRQWESFHKTVEETLLMILSIPTSESAGETAIIHKIINALEPQKDVKDFSFEQVKDIFFEIEIAHQSAKMRPASEIKTLIRNILHGKIEQFAAVTNHVDFARKVFAGISSDLISLPEFSQSGIQIRKTLDDFNERKPLISFLRLLQNHTDTALSNLPKPPKSKQRPRPDPANKKKINIIFVEDNKVWAEIIRSAIEKAKSSLGTRFEIGFNYFDNAEDALKAIPQINKTPLKTAAQDEIKTIAIVDICLPASSQQPYQIPNKDNGIELLKNLSDYKSSIPVIVFSTKSSLEDIMDIGKFGISDENFISKEDSEPERAITQSLIALIEKKQKYFIRRQERDKNGELYYAFSINGICIPFSNELNATFQALFELREEGDIANKTQFTAEEIYTRKLQNDGIDKIKFSKQEKHWIQSQINEIRELIYNTFRKNSRYIDVRDLIKTFIKETEEYCYELHAELPSLEDEENFEEDSEIFKTRKFNFLVVEKNEERRSQIVNALKSLSNTDNVVSSFGEDFSQTILELRPDIVSVDLQQIEYWKKIKSILPNERLGVIITTTNDEPNKKRLLGTVLKSQIPSSNFVSTNRDPWINSFLTKLDREKRRVFLGEKVDCMKNLLKTDEPIVEVLAGSDLTNGVLKLLVNNEVFTMNKSNISKIIGHLLLNSRTLIPLETIKKKAVGSSEPVTKDDQKGWTKKIRNKIQEEWLKTDNRESVMEILNSSEKGMKLNVQVIYARADK